MWEKIIKAASLVAGGIAGLFGGWTVALRILLIMMTVDFITGLIVAWQGRSTKSEGGGLSSKIGFIGLARKGFILLIVLVATQLDRAVGNTAMVAQTAAEFYYIANEGISILENATLMGVPVPAFIRDRLEAMREERDQSPFDEDREDDGD